MARDKQKSKKKEPVASREATTEALPIESLEIQEEVVVSEPEVVSAPVAEEPPVDYIDLHDAARQFIPNFKEHWWPGLRRHATNMGFGEGGTVDACKMVFRHYGAKI
jgi:hypothetical protein